MTDFLPFSYFPFSQLSEENKELANKYLNAPFVTWVKPMLEGEPLMRFRITSFEWSDKEKMVKSGWSVIDMTK